MRNILHKNLNRIIAVMAVIAVFIAVVPGSMSGTTIALAESTAYSNVLDDLQTDTEFNEDDYPVDSTDYSLSVIQVAESTDGELLIYVYQPSAENMPLTATQIALSPYEWNTENSSYSVYNLVLLSTEGVFQKYLVDAFEVSTETVRYYDISTIYRDYDSVIDSEREDDNTVNGIGFEVGKCWAATTDEDGNVSYAMEETQVVIITDMHVNFIRYLDGYEFWTVTSSYVDGHFVAFSTDWNIDKLYEVDISFITQPCTKTIVSQTYGSGSTTYTYGDEDYTYYYDPLTLTYDDTVSVDVSGVLWFSKTYTWNRIETIDEFMSDEEDSLSDDTVSAISDMQYVLRFYESEYTESTYTSGLSTTYSQNSTVVSEVRLLRLKFEADGVTYNLGAVSNIQTGTTTPDGSRSLGIGDLLSDIGNWFENLKSTVQTVLQVVLGIIIGVVVIWLVSWIVKLLRSVVNSIKRARKKDNKESKDKK